MGIWITLAAYAPLIVLVAELFAVLNVLPPDEPLQQVFRASDAELIEVFGLSVIATSLLATITFLFWIHASYWNLYALGAKGLEFSPKWAVGWFFVPILNLIRPYQIVAELWQASDPGTLRSQKSSFVPASPSPLIDLWWWPKIFATLLAFYAHFIPTEPGLEAVRHHFRLALVLSIGMDIPSLICQWLLIRRIQRFQEQRFQLIQQRENSPGTKQGKPTTRTGSAWGDPHDGYYLR